MSDTSPVTKPTITPIDTPAGGPVNPVPPVTPRASETLRREPPKTIVEKATDTIKAYALYVWADMQVLFVEIKPAFVKFGIKQKNFLIGLVAFILLLLWLF